MLARHAGRSNAKTGDRTTSWRGASQDRMPDRRKSALTSLEARVLLVDDVDASLAANQTVVAVTSLQRFERILDLHWSGPRFGPLRRGPHSTIKSAPARRAPKGGWHVTWAPADVNRAMGRNPPGRWALPPGFWKKTGEMAHLSSRTRLGLAIEMGHHVGRPAKFGKPFHIVADQVFHNTVGVARG